MCKYLITFKGGKVAEKKIVEALGDYDKLHLFYNVWFIESKKPASIIGDELKDFIGDSENIFITEISKNRDCWLNTSAGDFLNS
ncbi:MAG: hypothetical protein N4A38_01820 [Candidatus Gracilibacteria bacterium]|nr:hypothetical protein [Candidatus Gracilibacteria bacterium]